ncbi:MAG TPA: hypothetical protein VN397_04615 [Candidatus Methylomirabilis sp.]|nr:hypothetical protein [Candidatus Methylomirabilis sp.]
MSRLQRLEWISVIYLVLFVLAVLSPSLVQRDLFGIPEEHAEEVLIFLFGLAGLVTFSLYERVMERREKERDEAVKDRDKVRKELVDSYEYIGAVNRQVEALKRLANETATTLLEEDRVRKELFQSLAAAASALVRGRHASVRIVALDRMRTLKDFLVDPQQQIRVANKSLKQVHDEGRTHSFVRSDDGGEVLVIPSDRQDLSSKAFILVQTISGESQDIDPGLLKVYANQAEVLYRVLAEKNGIQGSEALVSQEMAHDIAGRS